MFFSSSHLYVLLQPKDHSLKDFHLKIACLRDLDDQQFMILEVDLLLFPSPPTEQEYNMFP